MQGCWDAETWNNQGLQAYADGSPERGLKMLQMAHQLLPKSGVVLLNLGFIEAAIGQVNAAARCYTMALEDPVSRASASKNLGFLELKQGNPQRGWALHHQRFADPQLMRGHWQGPEDRTDAPLLVWNDVGQGDAIQFSRYLPALIERGFRLRLAVQPPLVPLFEHWLPVAHRQALDVQPLSEAIWSGVKRHVPVMGLCRLLDPALRQASDCTEAYLVDPMPPKSNPVRELPPGRRIGLCWGTNPGDPSLYKQKSIPLKLLLNGIRWQATDHRISLQRGEHQDRNQWRSAFAAELPDTADWCETGRWILSCDLVISADTAVAHLCGALGIPVLVVLPFHPDWRWRYGSNPCRWYRSCTTLEQQRLGDWASLLPALNQALEDYPIR